MSAVIDIIIVLFLAMGAIVGFKRGIIKSLTMFFGTALAAVLAFKLKTPLANLMLTKLPMISLGGSFVGVEVFSILLYEIIAFLVLYAIFMSVVKILIKISGLFEMVLNFTVVLAIPSKILGAIFGFIEEYIILFFILFMISNLGYVAPYVRESNLATKILTSSPVLSDKTQNYYAALGEIYDLKDKLGTVLNKDQYSNEVLNVLLKNKILEKDVAKQMEEDGKLPFVGAKETIENNKGE